MNQDKLIQYLELYNELDQRAQKLYKELVKPMFHNADCYCEFTVDNDNIYFRFSTACYGHYDDEYYSLPTKFLWIDNYKELHSEIVAKDLKEKEDAEKAEQEKRRKAREQQEYNTFLELKKKYGEVSLPAKDLGECASTKNRGNPKW